MPLQTQTVPAGVLGGTAITTPENQAPNQARGTEQTEEEPGPFRKVSRTRRPKSMAGHKGIRFHVADMPSQSVSG